MPTPDRTSLDAIVLAARDLLEAEGLPGVTMQAVAVRVGVRAPSLYKRVRNRDDLLRLTAEATLVDLGERLRRAESPRALADTFRAFGHERPAAFQLVMTPGPGIPRPGRAFAESVSAPLLTLAENLAGAEDALEAARTLTAWAAGFVSMELNAGFNLGGDVDRAWRYGLDHLLASFAAPID